MYTPLGPVSYTHLDVYKRQLLRIAEESGIEVFLTGDRTLLHEQNLEGRNLGIVALSSVEWDILKNCLPAIVAVIDNALPGSFQEVDCGTFSRKKTAGE